MPDRPLSLLRTAPLLVLAVAALLRPPVARAEAPPPPDVDPSVRLMRGVIERADTDESAIRRSNDVPSSDARAALLRRFYEEQLMRLEAVNFDSLDQAGRIDYLLLRNKLRLDLKQLEHDRREYEEVAPLLPFARPIVALEEARQRMEPVDSQQAAKTLTEVSAQIADVRRALEEKSRGSRGGETSKDVPGAVQANRAARAVEELRGTLRRWNTFYSGYEPEFTWWMRQPYAKVDQDLTDYATFLRRRFAGFSEGEGEGGGGTATDSPRPEAAGGARGGGRFGGRGGPGGGGRGGADGNDGPVIGNPIGRQALLDALEAEMIPYTPEELIEIANTEFAWCEREMKRAADDLGLNGDWHKALDHVSRKHVKPGDQPKLIKELADEATKWVEERGLVTVPELCKESWRMEMMSVERQRVNPFFTGGEVISVSYPTDTMSHEDKLMSMRGNNPAFSRATVHHELIPGHHLQGFMARRYNTHRSTFRTPFLVEGWALYWEMLMWDKGFPRTAEDRVGMLFWRSHRCARIIFSLKFHLGQMTAQEAIDFLVERVGHERRNATAEVRRSFNGSYPPLYQAAYMLGGLQIRAMHRELVESGKMTDRQFHDAILRENSIPIAMIRASLTKQALTRDYQPEWRFYDDQKPREAKQEQKPDQAAAAAAGGANAAPARPRVYRDRVEPNWVGGGPRFWYRNDLPGGGREFILVDPDKGTRQPAFDHARVAEALAKEAGGEVKPDRLPVESIEFAADGKSLRLKGRDKAWALELETGALAAVTGDGADPSRLSAALEPRPSRRTGGDTEITFVNESGGEVQLFWSDPNGDRQPYGSIQHGERRAQHTYAGHVWVAVGRDGDVLGVFEAADKPATAVVERRAEQSRQTARRGRRGDGAGAPRERRAALASPDGKWEAFVKDHNLWFRNVESKEEFALSTDGSASETYGRDVVRDRAVGMNYNREGPPPTLPEAYWSPDSKRLVAMKTRVVPGRTVYLIESSPRDQVQPKLQSYPYLKPGDELPVQKPHLFDAESRKEIPVSDDLFKDPFDTGRVRWDRDSSRFTFLYNQRGHQALRIIAVDANTGEAKAIVDERSDTFIDYSGKQFSEYLEETGELVWMSERDGWNHLYLYDAKTGQVKNQITKGEWVVRGVDRVDPERRQLWFRAGGIRPGQDPYHVHYARVNFDGSGLTVLTEGDGTHAVQFAPGREYFIDTYSRVDLPPVSELRRTEDGSLVCKLEEADASELRSAGRALPERFVAKGRDGATDIYGIIHRPRNFDPAKKYPVIESIYAGPHSAHVPKNFRPDYRQQRLADRGFIIVQVDGMGTSLRSKKFHDVAWRNLKDAGFPDRILWMKAAAEKYPYIDVSRVGVYGGSAGGQNALGALLFHGDFYDAAVADCGCHDNRMDKIWWNEQWMGVMGPHYAENSNVTHAHRLTGKLMLTVGELDRNVDPASTMQVVNALIRADKDFDLVVFPGGGHGSGSSPYGQRRMTDFFVRHLLSEDPARGNGGERFTGAGAGASTTSGGASE